MDAACAMKCAMLRGFATSPLSFTPALFYRRAMRRWPSTWEQANTCANRPRPLFFLRHLRKARRPRFALPHMARRGPAEEILRKAGAKPGREERGTGRTERDRRNAT